MSAMTPGVSVLVLILSSLACLVPDSASAEASRVTTSSIAVDRAISVSSTLDELWLRPQAKELKVTIVRMDSMAAEESFLVPLIRVLKWKKLRKRQGEIEALGTILVRLDRESDRRLLRLLDQRVKFKLTALDFKMDVMGRP